MEPTVEEAMKHLVNTISEELKAKYSYELAWAIESLIDAKLRELSSRSEAED